jgi:hypothetical protein
MRDAWLVFIYVYINVPVAACVPSTWWRINDAGPVQGKFKRAPDSCLILIDHFPKFDRMFCAIKGSDLQASLMKYKKFKASARYLKISCNVHSTWMIFGHSNHPAPLFVISLDGLFKWALASLSKTWNPLKARKNPILTQVSVIDSSSNYSW